MSHFGRAAITGAAGSLIDSGMHRKTTVLEGYVVPNLIYQSGLAAKRPWRDRQLAFPNTKGGVNRRASVYEHFQRHREKVGLPKMRFHSLRDTAATLMIRSGVDVRTVADILGHADPAMTLRRYAHVLPDMRVRAANIIDSYDS